MQNKVQTKTEKKIYKETLEFHIGPCCSNEQKSVGNKEYHAVN